MRLSGRLGAAIEILDDFEKRRVPLKTAIADWSRSNRYAGAKDRAWISGLCLDALRRRNSLLATMDGAAQAGAARALTLAAARFIWRMEIADLSDASCEEPHGPGALTASERQALSGAPITSDVDDFPEWLGPSVKRVFGDGSAAEMNAFSVRADIDLRLNTLKAQPEKSLQALKTVKAHQSPLLSTAARIAAPDPSEKAPAVTVIPAFNKGWVEVQDLGSQIAALAAGAVKGAQVLDYCAGGGGKTLALAALMENTGQLYAYDIDARRLKPLYARAKRGGVKNLQVRSPAGEEGLQDLEGKMDVVFLDAPCSGAGTWRRHPDTKWRLRQTQLARRTEEQDAVLREGARYVKPGGRLIYVTCSFLMEENEDRLDQFLANNNDFCAEETIDAVLAPGRLTNDGADQLRKCRTPAGALRLTPSRLGTDGFFIASFRKSPPA